MSEDDEGDNVKKFCKKVLYKRLRMHMISITLVKNIYNNLGNNIMKMVHW